MPTKAGLPTIVARCKQTRFHLREDKGSSDVDIQGLDIVVKAPPTAESSSTSTPGTTKTKSRAKGKAKSDGTEILLNADLRLKAGVHYGLVGRNGTGKSTLLRAMAEKLIPGLPDSIKISILQQTDEAGDSKSDILDSAGASSDPIKATEVRKKKTVLQTVLQSDRARNEITRKTKILSQALEEQDDHLGPVRAVRQFRHEQLEYELFLAQKNASLKSGARGLQARKDLKSAECRVSESATKFEQSDDEITSSQIQEETQTAVELLNDLQSQFETMNLVDVEQEARKVLRGLGFKESQFDQPFESLSGGWRMRCLLAGVLIQSSDIMILDEPTNFLDLLGVIWLETYLTQSQDEGTDKTVIVVSHDRAFLNTVCDEIVIIKDQSLKYFKGNVAAYEEDLKAQRLYWGRMKEAQERQTAHMEATIRDNIKIGKKTGDDNKLKMAKSRQKKVDERMGVQVSSTGGRFKLNRDRVGWNDSLRAEIEVPPEEKGVSLVIPDAPQLRFPGPLISVESLTFKYRNQTADTPVLKAVDLVIHMGDRVGIMGLNGCGKTTLLRLLVGSLESSPRGKVSHHPRLKLGYYSQHSVEELHETGQSDPGLTALSLMCRETDGTLDEGQVRGLLGSLGLPGRTASDVPVSQLSGGQLVRLALARILWKTPHLLILDEVTTHLDFHTVLALSSALSTFTGAVLIVSHDRYLVRSVIEGKQDISNSGTAGEGGGSKSELELETADDEDVDKARRRSVYVLKGGKLQVQEQGVEQFEGSLEKKVRKMLA